MRVLHIIDSLGLGGAQTVVKGILESQKQNESIHVFALRQREVVTEIDHKNVYIYPSSKKYSLGPIVQLVRLIRGNSIQILHCHLFKSQVFGLLLKIIFFRRVRLVFHEHGGIVEDGLPYRLLMKMSRGRTSIYIACSEAMKRFLVRDARIPEGSISVLLNFVNLDTFTRENVSWDVLAEKRKIGILPEEFVFGFAGRLIERKGWREFIMAASMFLQSNRGVKFLVAGDGSQKQDLIDLLREKQLEKHIIYIGYTSDMVRFYSLLDCFVMSSYWEGLPMAQLEVLAMGIPLITANGPGMDEIATGGQSCIYTQVKDEKSISDAMSLIYNSPLLKKALAENAARVAEKYGLDGFMRRLDTIYSTLN